MRDRPSQGFQVAGSEPSDGVMLFEGNISRFTLPAIDEIEAEFHCAQSKCHPGRTIRRFNPHSQFLFQLPHDCLFGRLLVGDMAPWEIPDVGPASPVSSSVTPEDLPVLSEHGSNNPFERVVVAHIDVFESPALPFTSEGSGMPERQPHVEPEQEKEDDGRDRHADKRPCNWLIFS